MGFRPESTIYRRRAEYRRKWRKVPIMVKRKTGKVLVRRVRELLYTEVRCRELLSTVVRCQSLEKERKSILKSTRRFAKDLKGSRTGHGSQSSEVGGTEVGDGVGGSPDVREDLGMVCNRSCQVPFHITHSSRCMLPTIPFIYSYHHSCNIYTTSYIIE